MRQRGVSYDVLIIFKLNEIILTLVFYLVSDVTIQSNFDME